MFSDEEIDALLGGDVGASSTMAHLGETFRAYPGRDRANRLMFVDHHTYLPDDILALTDRMSMAASLEARTPFLDYRLVQFAASLPGSWKIRGDEWKIILKKAMAPLVPAEIITRGKWGFGGPVKSWMNKGLGDALRSFSHDGALVENGVFDRASFERIVESSYVNGVWIQAQKLWALLILELWCRAFLQPARPAAPAYALSELRNA
jgi:asparagine synthase (glutamine-hydrolysing)